MRRKTTSFLKRGGVINPFRGRKNAEVISQSGDPIQACLQRLNEPGFTEDVVVDILKTAVQAVGADGAYVLTVDPYDPGSLVATYAYSVDDSFQFPHQVAIANSLSGQATLNRQPVIVRSTDSTTAGSSEFGFGVAAILATPLSQRLLSQNHGSESTFATGTVTFVSTTNPNTFDRVAISRAIDLANVMSLAISQAESERFRTQNISQTLEQIGNYIENKDQYRRDHSARTARIAALLAEHFGLSEANVEELRVAATVMDIGYVSIPEAVLQKPSALTDYEYMQVRMHPVVGAEICQRLGMPKTIIQLVRSHHEKLDGTGYPDQLKNNDIPLGVRILTVADTFDSMRCARAHRAGLSQAEALRLLTLDSGTKLDPSVIQALRTIIEEHTLDSLYGEDLAA
jgi:putative nucleotidyltransferase with HDIG domain